MSVVMLFGVGALIGLVALTAVIIVTLLTEEPEPERTAVEEPESERAAVEEPEPERAFAEEPEPQRTFAEDRSVL